LAIELSWTKRLFVVVDSDAPDGLRHPDYAMTRRKGDEQFGFIDPPDLQVEWRKWVGVRHGLRRSCLEQIELLIVAWLDQPELGHRFGFRSAGGLLLSGDETVVW
jgi:hypothetical protein